MRRPAPRRPRPPSTGIGRRVVIGLVLFVTLCGLALFAFGGEVEPERAAAPERRSVPVTRRALRNAEEAERALMDRDYGRARERVRTVRRLLANLEREQSGDEPSSSTQQPE